MSGIFGIFNRNRKAVDKAVVDNMLDTMSYWIPDESGTWRGDCVALGHTMLWNTPESKYEHFPLKKDAYVLTMDARIDNRDELVKELELPDRPLEKVGDSEFILGAYHKWGEECPKYLLGDFAFAIWDEKKEQMFCARDHIGIKQFYYYLDDEMFMFANDMKGIISQDNISNAFDEETIAIFLKDHGLHQKRSTFFKNIKKLPAATTLTVTNKNVYENEFWKIENTSSITYKSDDEYLQELKKLFENAIDVRMRTIFPIASHLSGGIDSSSIAVYASRKLMEVDQNLYAYNWLNIPDNKNEYEYEAWSFSRKIAEYENIVHEEFKMDPRFLVKQYKEHNILTRGIIYYLAEYFIQDSVKKTGARTLLSGWGGDELISYNSYSYIEGLFERGKIYTAFKYLYTDKKYLKQTWKSFLRRIINIMKTLYSIKFRKMKNIDDQDVYDYYQYILKKYKHYMLQHKTKEFPQVVGVRKMQLAMFHYGHLEERIEAWAQSGIEKKLEYSYPLLDKRIVEFAMGIPEEMFYPRKGTYRHLFCGIAEHYLPKEIAWFPKSHEKKVNRSFKKFYADGLRMMQEEFANVNCVDFDQEYIDCEKIKKALQSFDFETEDLNKLGNITPAIFLLNSIYNIRKSIKE